MLPDAALNLLLGAFDGSHIGLHTAYPGATGASETTGGSPAYARKAATWAAAASGQRALSAGVTGFDVPAGVTIKWAVAWTALTAGNPRALSPVGTTRKGVATVQASTDTFTSRGHTLTNGMQVVNLPVAGEALPAGITEGLDLFVINATTDTFQLSTTSGGSAINVTADGECAWFDIVPATDAAQFKMDITSFTIDARFVKVN